MTPEEIFGREKVEAIRKLHREDWIEPLEQIESLRIQRWRTRYMWRGLSLLLVALGAAMMLYADMASVRDYEDFGQQLGLASILCGIVAFILFGLGGPQDEDIRSAVKKALIGPVIDKLGYEYTGHPFFADAAGRATDIGLLPKYDILAAEDCVRGTRSGLGFHCIDTQLIKKIRATKGPKEAEVFWGQCIQITLNRPVRGITIATRRRNLLSWRTRPKALQAAKLAPIEINRAFDVRTSDQVEARYLLTPDLMERIVALEKRLKGKRFRFGFVDRYLIIVVEKGDLFDSDLRLRKLDSDEALDKPIRDMAAIVRLIDTLVSERNRESRTAALL